MKTSSWPLFPCSLDSTWPPRVKRPLSPKRAGVRRRVKPEHVLYPGGAPPATRASEGATSG